MDKKHINGLTQALIIIPLLGVFSGAGAAESQFVLDPAQHPKSPEYQSIFSGTVVPLDSKVSWTKRFNGDETFNANQVLVQTTSTFANNSPIASSTVAVNKMDAKGVVKAIRKSEGKIKIKHGPIDKYGMPGMAMMFKVKDPSSLAGLKKGQVIEFNIDNSSGGFVVTSIMQTKTSAAVNQPMTMDAIGVVKAIRESEGKIKIKHGPIDKYGMPGMAMMFKVKDPSSLIGLKKGQEIGFNIDNSSGGFVVTSIMQTKTNAAVNQPMAMDAIGVVKAIRESQGKIKIKHRPIDKYGMPGMAMMFKVKDPSSLVGLKKGQEIGFNIDNSSGGFVVTSIIPTEPSEPVKQPKIMDAQGEQGIQPKQPVDQGTWFVQLMASRSLKEAEALWQRVGQSLPALKDNMPRYEKSEDMIRLLVTPGLSNQAASQLCQKLKQGGQDCFIRSIK